MKRKYFALILGFCLMITNSLVFSEALDINETTMDEIVNRAMVNNNLPGLEVILVQEGEVIFETALGEADFMRNQSMMLDQSVIQTGSISKVFTSYLLLQWMERKNIEVVDPIDSYLPLNIKDKTSLDGLTFANVLTHTTGITTLKADSAVSESPITMYKPSFGVEAHEFFKSYKLKPVIEKDEFILLSNVNSLLAGVLIESISGLTYEKAMSDLLETTFGMDLSASMVAGETIGNAQIIQNYAVSGGRHEPLGAFRTLYLPSDDFLTTADEISKFMTFMTGDRVSDEMRDAFFTRQVGSFSGRSYGMPKTQYGKYEVFIQDGGIPGSNSRLIFVPERNLSLFISYNSNQLGAREEITKAIFEEILPGYDSVTVHETYEAEALERFVGVFSPVNASMESIEKLTKIIHQVRVVENDQMLLIDKMEYVPVSETVFYNAEDNVYAEFKTDESGKLKALIIGNNVYTRASFFRSIYVEIGLLVFSAFFNLLAWLVLLTKWSNMRVNRIHDTPRVVLMLHTLVMTALLGFILLVSARYSLWDVIYGGSKGLAAIKVLGYVNALLIIPALMMFNRAKTDFRWSGAMNFVFRIQLILSVMLTIWLWLYNFI